MAKTLLQKAQEVSPNSRKVRVPSAEEIEIVLEYASGNLTLTQVSRAFGVPLSSTSAKISGIILQGVRNGKIGVNKS